MEYSLQRVASVTSRHVEDNWKHVEYNIKRAIEKECYILQKVYVLDSSVLLHDPNAIFQFQESDVVIPFVVLEEIESKKRLMENVGRAAREAIRQLDGLRDIGQLSKGVVLPSGGKIRIELNHYSNEVLPLNSDLALADNRTCVTTFTP